MPSHPPLGFLLHDVARFLRKRFEQRAKRAGLTRSQWQVLAKLALHEGIRQGGLAEQLEIEPITLARILDKMEARGLIERRRHPSDRRAWLLYLTPDAHPLLDLMWGVSDQTRAEAFAGISEAARLQLFETLTQMKINLIAACDLPCPEDEAEDAHD